MLSTTVPHWAVHSLAGDKLGGKLSFCDYSHQLGKPELQLMPNSKLHYAPFNL